MNQRSEQVSGQQSEEGSGESEVGRGLNVEGTQQSGCFSQRTLYVS
ncbi:MAG: hypothetical protein KME27_16145 [Lyngbya sp. HA4199-MV5]|nr:hypothetical protein [Lyngbya sp. HA4199-MV5]